MICGMLMLQPNAADEILQQQFHWLPRNNSARSGNDCNNPAAFTCQYLGHYYSRLCYYSIAGVVKCVSVAHDSLGPARDVRPQRGARSLPQAPEGPGRPGALRAARGQRAGRGGPAMQLRHRRPWPCRPPALGPRSPVPDPRSPVPDPRSRPLQGAGVARVCAQSSPTVTATA